MRTFHPIRSCAGKPTSIMAPMPVSTHALFEPFRLRNLLLPNRLVMAPMTRAKSPGGVPGANVAAYYRRRAEGGTGLLITEGTWVPHPTAGSMPDVPSFHGEDALAGWRAGGRAVHAAHDGFFRSCGTPASPPRGMPPRVSSPRHHRACGCPARARRAQSREEIAAVVAAFGVAARSASELGFDGVEMHGAHGYLIDQFLWDATNRRTDGYGGDLAARARFAVEVIREVRRQVGPAFRSRCASRSGRCRITPRSWRHAQELDRCCCRWRPPGWISSIVRRAASGSRNSREPPESGGLDQASSPAGPPSPSAR